MSRASLSLRSRAASVAAALAWSQPRVGAEAARPALAFVGFVGLHWLLPAFVGLHWLLWVCVGCCRPSLAYIGCCGSALIVASLHWPTLVVVGRVGCCGTLLAHVGWSALAVAATCGSTLVCVGCCRLSLAYIIFSTPKNQIKGDASINEPQ